VTVLETHFGWTLSGRLHGAADENESSEVAMTITLMLVAKASVAELWELEATGIRDPV